MKGSKTMKANENNGRIFNGSAYIVHRELARAKVHEDKVPVNQVQRVSETMMNLNKVIDEIRTKDWDTTSMESLYRLNSLIREANRLWDYIILMNRECVKCDGLLIQSELSHMLAWVFEEIFIHHHEEYMAYLNHDNETSTDSDVDTETSNDSQSESDDKESTFVDSILGQIKRISNNHVRKSPVEVYQAMKLDESTPWDELIDWNDVFASIADLTWWGTDAKLCAKDNNNVFTADDHKITADLAPGSEEVEKKTRPSKDEYYLGIAEAVSARSTCLRIHYGSIICNNDRIVSSGYNGAPMGAPNCDEVGECYRVKNNIPHFTRYETCQSVHSEMNAIINASRTDMLGGTLYLVGKDASSGSYVEGDCCPMCRRAVINAGISQVVFRTKDGGIRKVNVSDWTNDCMFNND